MTEHVVLVDAHRGASISFPENTLIAFEAAIAAGSDSVEFDVHLSSDGVPVVIHDETVDRTTGGSGEVASLTLDELQALDAGSWKAPSFAGEKIPTLDEALSLLGKMAGINMELKAEDPRLAEAAVQALESRGLHRTAVVSSFHLELLKIAKERLPEVKTRLFLDDELPDGFWEENGDFVDSLGIHQEHVTAEVVAFFRDRGRPVGVWTVDDPARAVELAAAGVESITTNDPLAILEVLGEAGFRGPTAPAAG